MKEQKVRIVTETKDDKIVILVQKRSYESRRWWTHKTIIIDGNLDIKIYNTVMKLKEGGKDA